MINALLNRDSSADVFFIRMSVEDFFAGGFDESDSDDDLDKVKRMNENRIVRRRFQFFVCSILTKINILRKSRNSKLWKKLRMMS